MGSAETGRVDARSAGDEALDDYSLTPVPDEARHSWFSVAVQRFGQVSSFQQFMVGAVLGYGMTFTDAVIAITVGSVMLEIVTILMGVAGVKEGVSTSVLARWSGFGRKGSAAVGMLVALSLAGWFGVQNGVFAQGMHDLAGGVPEWAWAVAGGAVVTAISVYGFKIMAWTAYLTVPAFLILAGWSVIDTLIDHPMDELLTGPPPGPVLSLAEGTTLVAGAFILGALMTPDMTRFNRRPSDVVKQTLLGVTLGEYVIGLTAVMLGHAARTADIVGIITTSSGILGTLILATSILKINDWNLYSSALATVNSVDVIFGRRIGRRAVTLVIGVAGTFLSAIGIADDFTGFLETIGVLAPPVAGIIIAEYYVVRRYRADLEQARRTGQEPDIPNWLPLSLVCWAVGTLIGVYLDAGIPAINAVVAAFALYAVVGRMLGARHRDPARKTPLSDPTA
ncbi:cytosine permease [Streptomyces somaliensis DSM 40738]|uniref:Cytosine permease n=1 Tax=Streptomyces somaliensis (strain ATCC 33201 / DSM 40738 / JCM 12659 / KCTC 9044 / NCTC 11332 / NRRL B-12077 / IP 733) TaxID=1134445 RepID=A0AA44DEP9_STRE0|nr:cytosine permease [Streptomyces somaliensis]MCQ0023203.1 cytosine permease [Streptomyces somaliensis DSM 40738]NKY15093.1 cytosine permease [Streptomyces somaliensis DSM 40738]